MAGRNDRKLESGIQSISIKTKPEVREVADSWEDEAGSSSDELPASTSFNTAYSRQVSGANEALPSAPLPSPIAPRGPSRAAPAINTASMPLQFSSSAEARSQVGEGDSPAKRPEKTTAPAARMIASSLGLRPQRRTQEERKYDKAAREQELKKREAERAAKKKADEEQEKARRDIWNL